MAPKLYHVMVKQAPSSMCGLTKGGGEIMHIIDRPLSGEFQFCKVTAA